MKLKPVKELADDVVSPLWGSVTKSAFNTVAHGTSSKILPFLNIWLALRRIELDET